MNRKIESVKLLVEGCLLATIDGVEYTIPIVESNSDYMEIVKWAENGGVIEEADPIINPTIIVPLTPRQFRDGLLDAGIMPDEITAKINEIPFDIEREKALNAWNYASMFYRDDPYIDMIAAMFEMTPEQVDTLWLKAQKGDR